jgi:transposase IS4-like protein
VIRSNRKGFPEEFKTLTKKLKPSETAWVAADPVYLLFSYHDTKIFTCLSTRHSSDVKEVTKSKSKKRKRPERIENVPVCVIDYNKYARGVDLHDQKVLTYPTARRSSKWWKYLLWHLFDSCVVNALILKQQNEEVTITQLEFRQQLAEELIQSHIDSNTPKIQTQNILETKGSVQHFLGKSNNYKLCNQCKSKAHVRTCYFCKICEVHLCPVPCFELFHTNVPS